MTSAQYSDKTIMIRNRTEKYITALMKRYFSRQRDDVIDKIESGRDPFEDWQKWDRILFDTVGPRIRTVINVARKHALSYMEIEPKPRDVEIVFKAGEVMQRLDKVNDTTREQIEAAVLKASKKGLNINIEQRADLQEYKDAISSIIATFTRFITGRSPVIGTTVSTSSVGAGVDMAFSEDPQKTAKKRWRAFLDQDTRDTHREADGQEVNENESFIVGGESLRWPGDPFGSPENIINCRCYVEPVV